jgi:hypothetical protein
MTATLSGPSISDYKRLIREKLKAELHQPVPEEAIPSFISAINKESEILLVDAGCVIALSLIENGHNPDKIFVAEGFDGEYKAVVEKMSERFGFHHIALNVDKLPAIMKFDYVLGNPPYKDKKEGSRSGSSDSPLWWQITERSFDLLKEDGIISFITPTGIVSGSDKFTSLFLGKDAKYDLQSVNFNANNYFNVGIEICSWVAKKSKPSYSVSVNDGRIINSSLVNYISVDKNFDDIFQTLLNYSGKKLTFNQSNRYDYNAVARELKKSNLPVEWSKELVNQQDEDHPYAVANNNKIKYSRVKWKDHGVWRVFVPQFSADKDLKFWVDDKMAATGTTWTHRCSSKEEAKKILSYVDTPEYKWIINRLRVSSRITSKIRSLPAESLEKVLSEDQLSYIQSQL